MNYSIKYGNTDHYYILHIIAAFFECTICHSTTTVEIDRGRIAEPTVCTHCNAKYTMTLVHNRSYFTDKQMVKLQESPGVYVHTFIVEHLIVVTWAFCLICTPSSLGPVALGNLVVYIRQNTSAHFATIKCMYVCIVVCT